MADIKAIFYSKIRCPWCLSTKTRNYGGSPRTKLRKRYHTCLLCKKNFASVERYFNREEFYKECERAKMLNDKMVLSSRKAGYEKTRGAKNRNWKGGRVIAPSGYVWVRSYDHPCRNKFGFVAEHRLIMEKKIGRYLKSKEQVHHINGIKNDNRPENLMLFKDQRSHRRYHAKIRGK